MKKLIPSFMTSKRSKSSPSSSSSSLDPLSQSIKAKDSPSSKQEIFQMPDISMLSLSPSTPSIPPPSFSFLVLKSELELAFHKFDANGDGRISPAEVRALLRCVGDEATEEESVYIVREADTTGDGFMDLHEFIDLIMRPPNPAISPPLGPIRESEEEEEELQCVFQLFDKDKNGFIGAEELHEMLWNLGEREVSLQDCRQMIHNVDCNKDGVVDFEEFKAMMIANSCA